MPNMNLPISVTEVADAYIYLLGRLLVIRQQQRDFEVEGFRWNEVVHRGRGEVDWANPCLDLVYSEAWIAVDDNSSVLLEIPEITDRYYSWHMLNGWGETVLNINERTFPHQPNGRYALCLSGTDPELPQDALRVDLPSAVSRVLSRVEISDDIDAAIRLQKQFVLTQFGQGREPVRFDPPYFEDPELPGVEAFDSAFEILAEDDDINIGMNDIRAVLAQVATLSADDAYRAVIDDVITDHVKPALKPRHTHNDAMVNQWIHRGGIGNYGSNFRLRTAVNVSGIWANNVGEYSALAIPGLSGNGVYVQRYAQNELPGALVEYFWSITVVDAVEHLVIPNPIDRYLLGARSALEFGEDGSLTIVFASELPEGFPQSNWLPIPRSGRFNLSFRLYGLRDHDFELGAGHWPPPVLRVDDGAGVDAAWQ